MGLGSELQEEGVVGAIEDLGCLWCGQDLDGLANPSEFLSAKAGSLGPFLALGLAAFLGLSKESLVGFKLGLRVIQDLSALGELLTLRRLVGGLTLQGGLQGLGLLQLGRHQSLKGLLGISLLGRVLLQITDESVVHALQDTLDLGGLGSIVAEGVVLDLGSRETSSPATEERLGLLDEAAHSIQILVRHRTDLPPAQGTADASHNGEKLGFPRCLQEATVGASSSASTCQHLDGCLQSTCTLF
mmetsp:Transcript_78316/g.162709  ORF Transcript_78316/g.162709 Transcript_78316/m.162709 type:complete len:244 (+) Transcript_78316:1082-1813(+)